MLSMLYPKSGARRRIVLPAWFLGRTDTGEPVQCADIEPWLADLPWRVEYDGFTDKFILTRTH